MIQVTVEISGGGAFPVDMLRYDRCSPARSSDASAIEQSIIGGGKWQVTVIKYIAKRGDMSRCACFTVDRWRSFGCIVNVNSITLV